MEPTKQQILSTFLAAGYKPNSANLYASHVRTLLKAGFAGEEDHPALASVTASTRAGYLSAWRAWSRVSGPAPKTLRSPGTIGVPNGLRSLLWGNPYPAARTRWLERLASGTLPALPEDVQAAADRFRVPPDVLRAVQHLVAFKAPVWRLTWDALRRLPDGGGWVCDLQEFRVSAPGKPSFLSKDTEPTVILMQGALLNHSVRALWLWSAPRSGEWPLVPIAGGSPYHRTKAEVLRMLGK